MSPPSGRDVTHAEASFHPGQTPQALLPGGNMAVDHPSAGRGVHAVSTLLPAGRRPVFVDGVRTPFGKAGPTGIYAGVRADDLVIKAIRELLRRNPGLP